MKKEQIGLSRYRHLYQKCRTLQQRLTKAIQSGSFYEWSKRKQQQVQTRLQRYNRQLNRLKGIATTSMKAVALGATLATINPQIIQAQDTPILNPFGITTPNLPNLDPEFVDIDGDGDLDLFISSGSKFAFSESNELLFYRNIGCAKIPVFAQENLPPITSTLSTSDLGTYSIAFGDVDGDEDFDLALSVVGGLIDLCNCDPNTAINVILLENVGTKTNPIFEQIELNDCDGGTVDPPPTDPLTDPPTEPVCLQDLADRYFPAQGNTIHDIFFRDLDGDGDLDFVSSGYDFRSQSPNPNCGGGGGGGGEESEEEGSGGPGGPGGPPPPGVRGEAPITESPITESTALLTDCVRGSFVGSAYRRNTGTPTEPNFEGGVFATPFDNSGYRIFRYSDIDNDGDDDLLGWFDASSGSSFMPIFYNNIGTQAAPIYMAVGGYGLPPLGDHWIRYELADIDADGDEDILATYSDGFLIRFFQNIGTPTAPAFADKPLAPLMAVEGNNIEIAKGDTSPRSNDNTDFGTTIVGGNMITKTFTIEASGANITLGADAISIGGAHAGDFTVVAQPANTVDCDGVTFMVKFTPTEDGIRTAEISINNNVGDSSPFKFAIQGKAINPEIMVSGNSLNILDGDDTPDSSDNTDFGSVIIADGPVSKTFTIQNIGAGDLTLGTDAVSLGSGTSFTGSDFVVTAQPASTVAGGGMTSFTVAFDPSVVGTQTIEVLINNNDTNENPFNFFITGTGFNGVILENTDLLGKDFSVVDPCSCSDPLNTRVNNEFLFHDVLTAKGTAGQLIQVLAPNDGEFLDISGNPVALPLTLSETSLNSGVYQMDFYHRSGVITNLVLQMNNDPLTNEPFTSSKCFEADCIVIPTMNQWGLVIFILLLMNLGLITIERKEQLESN